MLKRYLNLKWELMKICAFFRELAHHNDGNCLANKLGPR